MNHRPRIRSSVLLALALAVLPLGACKATDKALKGNYPITVSPELAEDLHAVYVFLAPTNEFEDEKVEELLHREKTFDYVGEFLLLDEGGTITGWQAERQPSPERIDHDAVSKSRNLRVVVARSYLQDNKDATVLVAALFSSPSRHFVSEIIPPEKMRRRGSTTIRIREGSLVQ